ncbi:MAG TPA: protein-glutamate O-methyltransferase CheR [Candidatus Limnocylindrales bacterium]|nr:protein-glutamate O-methyltransferase CheR [Candidatus Limnocylindrales bacterium]
MLNRSPEQASSLILFSATEESCRSLELILSGLVPPFPGAILVACRGVDTEALAERLRNATVLDVAVPSDGRCLALRGRAHLVAFDTPVVFEDATRRGDAGGTRAESAMLAGALASFDGYTTLVVLAEEHPLFTETDLSAVREAGGMVVHEQRGVYGWAIPPEPSDIGVPTEELAATLNELLSFEEEPALAQRRMLHVLLGEVRQRAGIDFREYKLPTIMRRIFRLMNGGGFGSLAEYLGYLRRHPDEYARLVRTLLINVTEFFRDPQLFEYLRDDVMPQLIEHASRNGNELRLWSAGCATGEEAYSLAILTLEALGERIGDFHVRIFATDLNEDAVAFARHGVYPESAFEGVPREYVDRYFVERPDGFEVKKLVRNLTVFGQHDLAQRAPFPRIDLILCRNVLIYFAKELQQRTLQLFAFSLRTDGYLALGKAETTSPLPEYFRPVHRTFKVYERYGPRVLIPPSSLRDAGTTAREGLRAGLARESQAATVAALPSVLSMLPSAGRLSSPFGAQRLGGSRASDPLAALTESAIGLVLVDRRYDIVAINHSARALLNIHGIGVGEDLLHSASGIDSMQLRLAIDAAFGGEGRAAGQEFEIVDPVNDASHSLLVTCQAQQLDAEPAMHVAIVLVDITSQVARRRAAERRGEDLRTQIEEMSAKLDHLTSRQRALLNANDELTTMNVELRTTNEHLLIAAEEATSAAEEIETLNEEMQATNEELETLNEELQATVEELNATNEELEARSTEYQELASVREEQRVEKERECLRLQLALDAVDHAIAVFGDDGKPAYENAAYRGYFERGEPAFERDGDGATHDPIRRARRGEAFSERLRLRYGDGTAVPVLVRAEPYRTDGVSGLVLRIDRVADGAAEGAV